MVFIYKKIVKGNPLYYLRISKRVGTKVVSKDIAYLGNSLEGAKKKILNLPKYKGEIRKSFRKINLYIESEHYKDKIIEMKLKRDELIGNNLTEVEACKLHYLDFNESDKKTINSFIESFATHFSYNTTSLEGNTITLEEARKMLESGVSPKDRTLREIYDLRNTKDVFLDIFNKKANISHNSIISIHKKLMKDIDERIGYRTADIRVIKSRFDSTPVEYVKADMEILINWYNENKKKLHPLALAGIFHHKFEKIHPFFDGNGRTGRILMNSILINNGYPPIIIDKKKRPGYLDALGSADKIDLIKVDKVKYKNLIKYISDEFILTYWNHFI